MSARRFRISFTRRGSAFSRSSRPLSSIMSLVDRLCRSPASACRIQEARRKRGWLSAMQAADQGFTVTRAMAAGRLRAEFAHQDMVMVLMADEK
jgi:hypothetical protein